MDKERFDRQLLLFGEEGQSMIEKISVAIVGLGGLGMHVAQQLSYLGVKVFTLIDKDAVDKSNLNRLVGANELDVQDKRLKVDVAERLIRFINPHAKIKKIPESFVSAKGFKGLEMAEFIFGCVDRDSARLILNEFCAAYKKPYMDIATDINLKENVFGGRMLYSSQGEMCLACKDLLNQEAMRYDFFSDAQKVEYKAIYGIPKEALGGKSPAVISLNGILASVAVTEFLATVTGLRPAYRSLEYKGMMGCLVIDYDPPLPDCYYCKCIYGQGDKANLTRYIKQSL